MEESIPRGKLIPYVSTHFQCVYSQKDERGTEFLYTTPLTKGKVYEILRWKEYAYWFKDDKGKMQVWVDFWGVVDYSFERNLKTILE